MEKLRLDLDRLVVESFDAGGTLSRGTVQGLAYTPCCDSIEQCKMTVVGTDVGITCQLECTGSCGFTYCVADCTHGQTNGQTCGCATAVTCAPNFTCTVDCM